MRLLEARPRHDLADDFEQLVGTERDLDSERARGALESREVVARSEQRTPEDAHALEDAVAVEQAVVEDGEPRLGAVDVLPVDVHSETRWVEAAHVPSRVE